MELHCRYHPTRVPILICSQCAVTVCPDCVPSWPERGMPRCVTCRAEMEPLGISEYVKPFWQCFDRFFKFPFKSGNVKFLLLVLFFSFLMPISGNGNSGGIFSLIPLLLFFSFIAAYLSAVGMKASDGNPEPPEMSNAWADGGFFLFFKAAVIMFVFSIAVALSSTFFGGGIAFAITLFGALAFPASLMLLFLEKEIDSAVSPRRIIGVISAIGLPYLFLWGLVTMLTSGPDILMSLPEHVVESSIFPRVFLLANVYFALVLFHLLGYVVYQYHYELGVSLPIEQLDSLRKSKAPYKEILIESEILIMEGRYHSALQALQNFLRKDKKHHPIWSYYFNLSRNILDNETEKEQMMKVAVAYFDFLISKKQTIKLITALRQLMHKFPDLKFKNLEGSEGLEQFLYQEKEHELLESLS